MSATPPSHPPIVEVLLQAIRNLLVIKSRLPVLKALSAELRHLGGGEIHPVRNGAVLQIARDSYDMLVIDLASLREGVIAKKGFFNQLKTHAAALRRFVPGDCSTSPTIFAGEQPGVEEAADFDAEIRSQMVARWNEILDGLFPGGAPVTKDMVGALINRFMKDTEPTATDRNWVRAHRFEALAENGARYAQSLDQIEQQIRIMERYFNDLLLVLTPGTQYGMHTHAHHAEATANDLADLIVLGSINDAVVRYRPADLPEHVPDLFWLWRARFFAAGGTLAEAEDG